MNRRTFYGAAFLVTLADQASKLAVRANVPIGNAVPLLGDAIRIEPTRNTGGAFGIMQAYGSAITLVSVIAILLIITAFRAKVDVPPRGWLGLALMMGGAMGNLIDRIRLGYVFDFINIKVWPVFNVADVGITAGFVVLALSLIKQSRLERTGSM